MEWIAWGIVFIILWVTASVVSLLLVMAIGMDKVQCTCDGDYDDDNDRSCARCDG